MNRQNLPIFALISAVLLLVSAGIAPAQSTVPAMESLERSAQANEVDTAAVLRRGDMVTVAGEGPRSSSEEFFIAAMAPPADDSDQWYVTLWTTADCPHCKRLTQDFAKTPELSAFIAAPEGKRPWAHYNVFRGDDRTQQFRREQYKITAYPTIVIQPPRDGSFGDPRNVVLQTAGYDDPAKLARKIQEGVRFYCQKMAEQGKIPPRRATASVEVELARGWGQQPVIDASAAPSIGPVGVDPPFATPTAEPIPTPQFFPPAPAQPQAPAQQPAPGANAEAIAKVIEAVLSMFGITLGSGVVANAILLILAIFAYKRTFAPSAPANLSTDSTARPNA